MRVLFYCWDAWVLNLVNEAAGALKAAGRIEYAAAIHNGPAPRALRRIEGLDVQPRPADVRTATSSPAPRPTPTTAPRSSAWTASTAGRRCGSTWSRTGTCRASASGRHHYKYGTPFTPEQLLSVVCSSLVNVEEMLEEHRIDCVIFGTPCRPVHADGHAGHGPARAGGGA